MHGEILGREVEIAEWSPTPNFFSTIFSATDDVRVTQLKSAMSSAAQILPGQPSTEKNGCGVERFCKRLKNPQGEIIGLWIADADDPNVRGYVEAFCTSERVPIEFLLAFQEGRYRKVQNYVDKNGGTFLMFGSALAPGENSKLGSSGGESVSLGSNLLALGRAAFEETKRNAHVAVLMGRINKLRLLDLNNAYYTLGKRCHDLEILSEELTASVDAINALKKRVAEMRAGVADVGSATNGQKIKQIAVNAMMNAEGGFLSLKLYTLYISLGKKFIPSSVPSESPSEFQRVQTIKQEVLTLRNECDGVRLDHGAQESFRHHLRSVCSSADSASSHFVRRRLKPLHLAVLKLNKPKLALWIGIAVVALLAGRAIRERHRQAEIAAESEQHRQVEIAAEKERLRLAEVAAENERRRLAEIAAEKERRLAQIRREKRLQDMIEMPVNSR